MKKLLMSLMVMIMLVACSNGARKDNQNNTIQVVMDIENYGEVTIELYRNTLKKLNMIND